MRKRPPGSDGSLAHLRDLLPDPANVREHTPRNIGAIVESLQRLGAARSIVIDEDNRILAGNGLVEAAGEAGLTAVRIVEADGQEIIAVRRRGMTEEQKRQYAIADNRSGELSDWNIPLLKEQLAGLGEEAIRWLGFSDRDWGLVVQQAAEPEGDRASLADRFGVPPFSVLDARQGYWQARKRAWLALGIQSELGRGENALGHSDQTGNIDFYSLKRALEAETGQTYTSAEARKELKARGRVASVRPNAGQGMNTTHAAGIKQKPDGSLDYGTPLTSKRRSGAFTGGARDDVDALQKAARPGHTGGGAVRTAPGNS